MFSNINIGVIIIINYNYVLDINNTLSRCYLKVKIKKLLLFISFKHCLN